MKNSSKKNIKENSEAFIHIPKAAENTLRRLTEKHYEPSTVFTIHETKTIDNFKQLSESKRALVVLRMHCSGTSALTRVLSLCGASLPQRLMKPIVDNIVNWVSVAVDWATHTSNGGAVSSEELDAIRCAFLEADKAYGPIIARFKLEQVSLSGKSARLSGEVKARDNEISRLSGEVKARDNEISRLSGEVKARDERVIKLESGVLKRTRRIEDLESEVLAHSEEVTRLKSEIAKIEASTLWRITSQLRILALYIRRIVKLFYWVVTFQRPQKSWEQKMYSIIAQSRLFNADYYLRTYPDVASVGIDPLKHFIHYYHEGRNPNHNFDTNFYLRMYPDVAEANINPLLHYILYGRHEGRKTK
jgi:hypothetical protein